MTSEALTARLREHAGEFGAGDADIAFMQGIVNTVLSKQGEIDAVIVKAAPEWPLEKIAIIDRNVLRIGLAELLYADRKEVPAKVAINEAIELAKTFGSETSGKFVNGVLGAVYVELGSPGKDDTQPKKGKGAKGKKEHKEDKDAPLLTEELVGVVIYAQTESAEKKGGEIFLALVHDIFGHWTLSKSKLLPDELYDDGARRTALAELGLEVATEDDLGENEYVAKDPGGGKKRRHARYLLAKAPLDDLGLKREGGLDDAQWFPLASVSALNFYDDIQPIISRAITILSSKQKPVVSAS